MMWALDTGPDPIPGLNTSPPPPQEEHIQDFLIRRARLILRGKISSLEIVAQLGQDNIGSKVLRDDAGFRFKDAFINYRKADVLQVAVGQFKVPFLRQNLESGFNQLLVDRSLVSALRPAIEGQRDQGGMIWGSHGGFQYRAALFDGSDQEDANAGSSLRSTGRVVWNWFTPEPGFAHTGTTFGEKRTLQIAAQIDAQDDRLEPRDEAAFQAEARQYRAWAGELFYEQPLPGDWSLVAEAAWLERRDDYESPGLETRAIDGAYLQAGCALPRSVGPGRLQIAGRWELIRTERDDAIARHNHRPDVVRQGPRPQDPAGLDLDPRGSGRPEQQRAATLSGRGVLNLRAC